MSFDDRKRKLLADIGLGEDLLDELSARDGHVDEQQDRQSEERIRRTMDYIARHAADERARREKTRTSATQIPRARRPLPRFVVPIGVALVLGSVGVGGFILGARLQARSVASRLDGLAWTVSEKRGAPVASDGKAPDRLSCVVEEDLVPKGRVIHMRRLGRTELSRAVAHVPSH